MNLGMENVVGDAAAYILWLGPIMAATTIDSGIGPSARSVSAQTLSNNPSPLDSMHYLLGIGTIPGCHLGVENSKIRQFGLIFLVSPN